MPPQHLHSENCSNTRLDMSHSSSNTFETHNNNNNGGSTKIDVTSAYIANMKMLNQLMMNHSQRQLLSKNNSLSLLPLPTSGRHFSHQLTPNDSPESVRETNTSLAFSHSGNQFYKQGNNSPSDHHPKGLDCINLFDTLETVDAAVYLAQSQDSNGYNSSLGDRAYGQLEKHTVFCPMEEQEDQEREYGDFSRGEDEDAAAGTGSQHDGNENRFRHYQADQWTSMLEDLIEFRRRHGHCNVPHTSKELPALGRWVISTS
jgi:Helicase associated domain